MTASALRTLRAYGAEVVLDGGNLRLRASTPLPPSVVATLRAAKTGLLHLLTTHPDALDRLDAFEERAAILEFDAHLPRAEAEHRAWREVYGATHH